MTAPAALRTSLVRNAGDAAELELEADLCNVAGGA